MKYSEWMFSVAMSSVVFSADIVSSQSPNCGWQTIDFDRNSPTYNPTGLTCSDDKCCSRDGFCTSSNADCEAGCQRNFGSCMQPLCGIGSLSDSDKNLCSHTSCCSAEGFCGSDEICKQKSEMYLYRIIFTLLT